MELVGVVRGEGRGGTVGERHGGSVGRCGVGGLERGGKLGKLVVFKGNGVSGPPGHVKDVAEGWRVRAPCRFGHAAAAEAMDWVGLRLLACKRDGFSGVGVGESD